MGTNKYISEIAARMKSIVKKTIIWTCSLYIFYIFHAPQSDYISKQVSDAVVKCFIFVLTALFVLLGLYIIIAILLGNESDIENICKFILENHISIMIAIILNNR
tara:strand:+ start:79 stop:393 length:315 start_codon:yes stop_codon:yes gene_type:complete